MKELIKKSLVLGLLFIALQGNASVNPTLQNLKDGRTTVLTLSNAEEGDSIFIKNQFGKVMYEHAVATSGSFVRGYNLTNFHKGSYYFELNSHGEQRRIAFRVVNKKIEIDEDAVVEPKTKKTRKSLFKKNSTSSKKPIEIEKGVQRRLPTFKGRDFVNYINTK